MGEEESNRYNLRIERISKDVTLVILHLDYSSFVTRIAWVKVRLVIEGRMRVGGVGASRRGHQNFHR